MSPRSRFIFAFLFALPFCNNANAHLLSPCYRVLTYENGKAGQEPIRYQGKFCGMILNGEKLNAVHEHMTAATIRVYRNRPEDRLAGVKWKWEYMVEEPWDTNGREHRSFPIIFGSWWNDDPLMLALGQSGDFALGGTRAWAALKPFFPRHTGARRGCKVKTDDHLARASHLGRLQHLHFMSHRETSEPDDRVSRLQRTTDTALVWMKFAYEVASGDLPPGDPLTAEMENKLRLPSTAANHCEPPEEIRIRTLFARDRHSVKERDRRMPDIAIGSMLHILQDSFGPSHACRVSRKINGQHVALLRDVHDYLLQNKKLHAKLDQYPAWLLEFLESGEHRYANDPVSIGAWLMDAVDRRLPWSDVETHLRETIFLSIPEDDVLPDEKCITLS